MSKLRFQLTEQQKQYLPVVEWLLDFHTNRATGRSYLMAVAFIRMALRHLGTPVRVFDHHPTLRASRHVLQIIKDILAQDEELFKRCEFWADGFVIHEQRR